VKGRVGGLRLSWHLLSQKGNGGTRLNSWGVLMGKKLNEAHANVNWYHRKTMWWGRGEGMLVVSG